jgi:dihydroorotate dehydrogenase electron transfer subunit
MKELLSTIKNNEEIAQNIWAMTLSLPEEVGCIHGGQFVNLSVGDGVHLLKRPLGICKVEKDDVTVCYQVKGSGTIKLTERKKGEKLNVLLPLGNGFLLPESAKNIAVIGGGVGIFPLIAVLREYAGKKHFESYIGFRNRAAMCLTDELQKSDRLTITTDDGSYGRKGNAVQAYFADTQKTKPDLIIACGPPVMLRVLQQQLQEKGENIPCLVSLEERMGCGIGACLVCVCAKKDGTNARVCKDGPVFDINEVVL